MSELLKTFSTQIDTLSISEKLLAASIVTLLCMGIVISVLVLLMYVLKALEKINLYVDNKGKQKEVVTKVETAVKVEETVSTTNNAEEEIAAIMACINLMYDSKNGKRFVVNKINRKSDNKVLWQTESRMGQ